MCVYVCVCVCVCVCVWTSEHQSFLGSKLSVSIESNWVSLHCQKKFKFMSFATPFLFHFLVCSSNVSTQKHITGSDLKTKNSCLEPEVLVLNRSESAREGLHLRYQENFSGELWEVFQSTSRPLLPFSTSSAKKKIQVSMDLTGCPEIKELHLESY